MGDSSQLTKKRTNFTIKHIEEYLNKAKTMIIKGNYSVAKHQNRKENQEFMEDYRIDTNKEKEILLSLTHFDFCYAVDNLKKKYRNEVLYVFCKEYQLDRWGELENVEVYIKTNVTTTRGGDFLFIISFHKLNRPITFLFR